jgi:hypothetical protein
MPARCAERAAPDAKRLPGTAVRQWLRLRTGRSLSTGSIRSRLPRRPGRVFA